jgi:hypothetical protein
MFPVGSMTTGVWPDRSRQASQRIDAAAKAPPFWSL